MPDFVAYGKAHRNTAKSIWVFSSLTFGKHPHAAEKKVPFFTACGIVV